MQKRRLVGASTLALLVAVGLSGCLKMDMQLELQSDDTVDGTIVIAVASEYADMLGASPEEFAEQLQAETIDLEGTETIDTEPYDDGEYVGSRTVFEGQTLETFNANDDPDALQIVREGNEFVVAGAFDMTDEAGDMGMFGGEFDIVVAITFPGTVSSHDGELSGNTVTWRPPAGERTELNARGSAVEGGGSGLPIFLLIGLGVLALVVIGVIIWIIVRSGKKSSQAPAPAGYADPAGQAVPTAGYAAPPPAPPTVGPPPPAPDAGVAPPAPETAAPEAPVADAPVADAPVADAPVADAPVADAPAPEAAPPPPPAPEAPEAPEAPDSEK